MENTSKLNLMKRRDVAYYRQRQKNEVFAALVAFFADEAKRRGISKKELATALSKDPSQITRWLSAPSNFELDTLSDILLAMDAEMEHRIVRFSDRPKPNVMHHLVARVILTNTQGAQAGPSGSAIKFLPPTAAGMTGAAVVVPAND
jgi:hypothetical protein